MKESVKVPKQFSFGVSGFRDLGLSLRFRSRCGFRLNRHRPIELYTCLNRLAQGTERVSQGCCRGFVRVLTARGQLKAIWVVI